MPDEIQCAECSRPVGDRLTLCTHCGDRLRAELLSVPGVLADLTTMRAGQARMSSGRVGSRSSDKPMPVQSVARLRKEGKPEDPVGAELRGDRGYTRLETAVFGWAKVLAEHLGVEIPIGARALMQMAISGRYPAADHTADVARTPDGKYARTIRRHPDALASPATLVEQAAVWMGCHPHELRTHEAARDMLTDITGALKDLRRVIDRPAEMRYLGPCSECGAELRAERGETWVRCRVPSCKTQHEISRLESDALAIAWERLYTLSELGSVLSGVGAPVPRRTLYSWAAPGKDGPKLHPRGWRHEDQYGVRITDHQIDPRDKQVYRLGDVVGMANKNAGGSAA
ncbi:hypothetical protein ACWCW7_35270 [Nocardia tengchongensis]